MIWTIVLIYLVVTINGQYYNYQNSYYPNNYYSNYYNNYNYNSGYNYNNYYNNYYTGWNRGPGGISYFGNGLRVCAPMTKVCVFGYCRKNCGGVQYSGYDSD